MKNLKIFGLTILLLGLLFTFTPSVKAANKMGVIIYPKAGATFYKGETINYKAQVTNNTNGPAYPYMLITKENSSEEAYKEFIGLVPGETSILQGSFSTANIKNGTYYIVAYMNYFTGLTNNVPGDYIQNKIYIKDLKKPTKMKAKGKKKAIKISYKKTPGANQYYIYRSKKAKKGYKLIAKTTKTSYTNKKLKKGKRYYYKVKSVRTVNGNISSSYSKVVSAKTK